MMFEINGLSTLLWEPQKLDQVKNNLGGSYKHYESIFSGLGGTMCIVLFCLLCDILERLLEVYITHSKWFSALVKIYGQHDATLGKYKQMTAQKMVQAGIKIM